MNEVNSSDKLMNVERDRSSCEEVDALPSVRWRLTENLRIKTLSSLLIRSSYIATKIASQITSSQSLKGPTERCWRWGGEKIKRRSTHQRLICMPQLSSTSKYPCHLGDVEAGGGASSDADR